MATAKIPLARRVGSRVAEQFDRFLGQFPEALSVANRLGDPSFQGPDQGLVTEWQGRLRSLLGAPPEPDIHCEWGVRSPVQGRLFQAWLNASGDPEDQILAWVEEGAPLGVERPILARGIFPKIEVGGRSPGVGAQLEHVLEGFTNYASVEDNFEAAKQEVQRYLDREFAVSLTQAEALRRYPDGSISKIALLTREKNDGTVKHRIIVDLKRSKPVSVNLRSSVPERPVLPRLRDAVKDLSDLARFAEELHEEPELEAVVADFSDAYMHLRVHPDELRHCLSSDLTQGRILVWITLCFGLAGAPLIWSRLAAAAARLAQAAVCHRRARLQLYLDDPIIALSGPSELRSRNAALILWCWLALGLRVAWGKTKRGLGVTWIGVHISLSPAEKATTLALPETTREDLLALLRGFGARGMLSLQALRAVTGKLAWVMGILVRIRWAVAILYAVVADVTRDGASGREASRAARRAGDRRVKRGLVHYSRVRLPLQWLIELFTSMQGPVVRVIDWKPARPQLCIIVDASPWGLGAVLAHAASGKPLEWLASSLDKDDEAMLDLVIGSSTAQQVAETLALLLALRVWIRFLRASAASVDLRGDSTAALGVAGKLSSATPVLNFLAAELALALEAGDVREVSTTHVPGSWNVTADALSRLSEPGSPGLVPQALAHVKQRRAPARGRQFYALPPPGSDAALWGRSVDAPALDTWRDVASHIGC